MAQAAEPTAAAGSEAARGKTAADENFPVGSRLIRAELRPHVMAFYAFARAADDVADDPALPPPEKLRRLDAFEAALAGAPGPSEGAALRASLAETGVSDAHARDLLKAFRRDATEGRCADWAALASYCAHSAHPVGRFMLDLHGEAPATRGPSDALTAALQVLNHLQDLGPDRARLDRVYLPLDWLAEAGATVEDLDAPRSTPALEAVRRRMLDGVDALMATAEGLPGLIRSRRLGAEAAVIVALARRLSAKLRARDPLAERVSLGRRDGARAALAGLGRAMRPS